VDGNGNVVSSEITGGNSNGQLRQAALEAAKRMQFTSPEGGGRVAVKVTINFTVEGSDFDRQARERQEQLERERQQRERERQAQLERERRERERQEQLEQERQERERQEQERQ
jgi:TonB family protein